MTMKHEALRLFLAVTALILTAMLTNPNDSQENIGVEKSPSHAQKISSYQKKSHRFFFRKMKKRVAVASDSHRKTAVTD